MTAPKPIKKLCAAKPEVLCLSGNISPTKALDGSMEPLIEASNSHSIIAAIHNSVTFGKMRSANEARIAPIMKNGLLLPHRFDHVLSLIWPMIG